MFHNVRYNGYRETSSLLALLLAIFCYGLNTHLICYVIGTRLDRSQISAKCKKGPLNHNLLALKG
jgi:hypothetical protein